MAVRWGFPRSCSCGLRSSRRWRTWPGATSPPGRRSSRGIRFHRRILPFQHGFVAASFADVTTDFGAVTERVNAAFGTNFGVFEHTPENEAAVFAEIEAANGSSGATR